MASFGAAQRFDAQQDVPADWWSLFNSPKLNALVERALKASPDIEAAQAALRQAQQYARMQRSAFFPVLGAGYSASRTKLAGNDSGNAPGPQNNGDSYDPQTNSEEDLTPTAIFYNYHVAQLSVGYAPDIFGAVRRQVEALNAQVEASRFELEAARITLASNVTAAAFQEASLRAQIAAMQNIVAGERETLGILQKRLDLGDIAGVEVAVQESALAQAEATLSPLRLQLELTRDQLRALLGNPQDSELPETFTLDELQLPQNLPLTLPSRLVEQRPDVRIAEAALHAASAEYGVAVAARLPQFVVSGAVGGMAPSPNWMFKGGGGFFDLSADIAYTIFDGGALRAQSRAAQEALIVAGAQYRATVIAALQDVADTLHTLQSDAEVLDAAARNQHALGEVVRVSMQKQYEAGYVSHLDVLAAEQEDWQTRIDLAQAQAARLSDTAALYQALGGGWWNRVDDAANEENAR
jgi:NodT family efflux transporter outer membrane factor (OMF) lipoprotein